ncbi:MAG: VOC family protein [SAR202 cluster bacterium]|nr:VOC family protein [SAR202 cluster bacterium]
MPNPVVHFEIYGKSQKLQEFYKKVFDWHVDSNNPMDYGFVDTHAGGINGGIPVPPDKKPRVMVYIEVKDLNAFLKKIEKAGGKTLMPPTEIPGVVTFAQFADPDGNAMAWSKLKPSKNFCRRTSPLSGHSCNP